MKSYDKLKKENELLKTELWNVIYQYVINKWEKETGKDAETQSTTKDQEKIANEVEMIDSYIQAKIKKVIKKEAGE